MVEPRSRGWSLLAVAACCSSPLAAAASDGEHPVGAITFEVGDGSARKFAVELFYEAAAGTRAEELSFRPPLRPILVARGAEARRDVGRRPLVVLSHGNWGSRY